MGKIMRATSAMLLCVMLLLSSHLPLALSHVEPIEAHEVVQRKVNAMLSSPWHVKLDPSLKELLEGRSQDSPLDGLKAIVLGGGALTPQALAEHVKVKAFLPLVGFSMAIVELSDAKALVNIASIDQVAYVLADHKMEVPACHPLKLEGIERIDLTQINATRIMRAIEAWKKLKLDGSGVKIAIVDTGVDFGIRDLRQARRADGIPLSLDTTGLGIVIVNLIVEPIGLVLPVKGKTGVYFDGKAYDTYAFPRDVTISVEQKVLSKSGRFAVGIAMFDYRLLPGRRFFPVVMVDSKVPGVYDTALFDLSTLYASLLGEALKLKFPMPFPIDLKALDDFSVADESPRRWGDGTEAIARDINGDGYPDVSLGSLAWVHDRRRPGGLGIIPGIGAVDREAPRALGRVEEWRLIGFQHNRWSDHGTLVAVAAASAGINEYFFSGLPGSKTRVPGVAKGASIMSLATDLFLSEIIQAWLWASGLEPRPGGTGFDYLPWRRADIISNSWGVDRFNVFGIFPPGASPLSALANLLSIPKLLHPDYPGVVMIFAAGNSGYGYGTVIDPSAAILPISVGASTSWFWIHYITNGTQPLYQGYDDIVHFSSKGPTMWGYVKPDVMSIGLAAIGLVGINWWSQIWGYIFHGYYITTLWGGTSLSAPLVAGAAAIVIQAFKEAGAHYDPQLVKDVLMSTASDIGYDPFSQGSGRVDVFKAASFALGLKGEPEPPMLVRTDITYEVVRRIQGPVYLHYFTREVFFGRMPPDVRILTASAYLGYLSPGSIKPFDVEVRHLLTGPVELMVKGIKYERVGELRFTIRLTGDPFFVNLVDLVAKAGWSRERLLNVDLLRIFIVSSQEGRIAKGEKPPYAYLVDWLDEDKDGVYDLETEQHRYSFDYRIGASLQLNVAKPLGRFKGVPGIVIRNPGEYFPKDLLLVIEQFKRVTCPAVSMKGVRAFDGAFVVRLEVSVPKLMSVGIHQRYVEVIVKNATHRSSSLLPLSWAIVGTLTEDASLSYGAAAKDPTKDPYENFLLYGGEHWEGWPNTADYRFYPVLVTPKRSVNIVSSLVWSGKAPYSQVNVFVMGPDQTLVNVSPIVHVVAGQYTFSTTTDALEQVLVTAIPAASGVYTIVAENVLGSGLEAFPSSMNLRLSLIPLDYFKISIHADSEARAPSSLAKGLVAGNLTASFVIKPEAAHLLKVMRVDIHKGLWERFVGRIRPVDPIWVSDFLPGWPNKPTLSHSLRILKDRLVFVELDWGEAEADLDLVVLTPKGPPVERWWEAAGLRKPERMAFTAHEEGLYTFKVVLYSGPATDYVLRIRVIEPKPISRPIGKDKAVLNTRILPDGVPSSLIVVPKVNFKAEPPLESLIDHFVVTPDNTPPKLIVEGIVDGAFVFGDFDVVIKVDDLNLHKVIMAINGVETEVKPGPLRISLDDGDHRLTFKAVDLLNHETSVGFLVRVDRIDPWVKVEGVVHEQFVSGVLKFTVRARPLYLDKIAVFIDEEKVAEAKDGEFVSIDTRLLADGPHVMRLEAIYISGKKAVLTLTINVDNTHPFVELKGIEELALVRGTISLKVKALDRYLDAISLMVGDLKMAVSVDPITGEADVAVDTRKLADGDQEVVLMAYDKIGHVSIAKLRIRVDNTPPSVAILSPAPGSLLFFTTEIKFSVSDANLKRATLIIGGVEYDVTDKTSFSLNTLDLRDGEHEIRLEAEDLVGNFSATSITIRTFNYALIGGSIAIAIGAALMALLIKRRKR